MEEERGGIPPRVSVFIPARNEEGNVGPCLEKVARALAAQGIEGEVILVNDGSTDGTLPEAEAVARRYPFIRIFDQRRNQGFTEALRIAFREFSGDVIVILPADLESDPEEDIPKLLDRLEEGYDVVAGWRRGRKSGKVPASAIYNAVSRLLFNVQAHDMNWIKALRREVVESLPPLRSDWHRFLLMIAASQGYRVGEVRVNYYPRERGRSKYGFWRIPVSFLDVLVVKFLLTFSRKPMLFFGSIGSFLLLVAGGIGVFLLYLWFFTETQKRPIFIFGTTLAIAGLLLFLVGFLAELVVSQAERLEIIEWELQRVRRIGDEEDSRK
jgi:glycosyltransferase involved in cell wall biosynthesis